ncbi:MAG: putative DNA binding domain-containing protein [Bacteroidia bacterium]|nr:putative DNA binding domain-containing protein [Bacteroidia bacterium]
MNQDIRIILEKLEYCLKNDTYEGLETQSIELKPSLPNVKGKEAKSIYQSINAFLNTKGGIIIIGIKDWNNKTPKRYELKGYIEEYENPLKAVEQKFTIFRNSAEYKNISNYLQYEIIDFLSQRICILYVNELPEDEKFVYFEQVAYKRVLTGDTEIQADEIEKHEAYKEELKGRRELLPVEGATIEDISIDKINDYIYQINRRNQLHNTKPNLESAIPFLIQKMFLLKATEQPTVLGMLVCGNNPETFLGLRATVRVFLHSKIKAADDKDQYTGNVLDLMRRSLSFVLKSIQVGVTRDEAGKDVAEYPENLISESINNALAHRDYKMDDYVRVVVRPNEHIEITNPGSFKTQLVIQELRQDLPFRRIIPASKPTNPNLAQVLSIFAKWEGLGNGMAGLVSAALESKTDVPYYKFNTSDSLSLYINKGKLIDDSINLIFEIYEGYIRKKLKGNPFSNAMKEAFAYLYKSQLLNQKGYYTILLTSDNNHEDAIENLCSAGLIYRHPKSPVYHDVFMVDNAFIQTHFGEKMLEVFGIEYERLNPEQQSLLQLIYQYNTFNETGKITANKAGNILWFRKHKFVANQKEYDAFKRKIRTQFNQLEIKKFITREGKSVHTHYMINSDFLKNRLF